ncbi:MAG: efflux RND transporter periplasmic adaptor subunit [Geothrix sp.]|nr:efflux RND transporter periplasmic adaptor subunit [Geothrix sp.]
MKRNTWIGLGLGLAAVGGGAAYVWTRPKDEIKWRMAKVDRANVTQRVVATGIVNPVVQVAVGTQVSGVITALYVDYNSIVKKGQLIAEIDPTVWISQLQDAQATLDRAQAAYNFAKVDYERSRRLWEAKLLDDSDLDTKDTALKTAAGNVTSAKAALDHAKTNLDYCRITAPVDGVVISRLADVGQTVAASFSTPSLYMIAQDLSRMKIWVSIAESDIDDVKVGQRALFNVDSLPDRQFTAKVSLVRQEPVTNNNVVTYVVEMITPNEPLSDFDDEEKAPAGKAPKASESHEAPDPERAWERMKDRLPAGTTKEAFLKRFQERQAERQVKPLPMLNLASNMSPQDLARIPGGSSMIPGPRFTGNLALRSGMTANVTIETAKHYDVLRVPNAALRFNPAAFIKDEKKTSGPRLGQPMMFGGGRPGGGAQSGTGTKGGVVAKREDRIWVLENGKPKDIVVKAGISDGQFTEVSGEGLTEGMQVLVGVDNSKQAGSSQAPAGGGRR